MGPKYSLYLIHIMCIHIHFLYVLVCTYIDILNMWTLKNLELHGSYFQHTPESEGPGAPAHKSVGAGARLTPQGMFAAGSVGSGGGFCHVARSSGARDISNSDSGSVYLPIGK